MLFLGLGRAIIPGSLTSNCTVVSGDGICVQMSNTLAPQPTGGGLAPSTGTFTPAPTDFTTPLIDAVAVPGEIPSRGDVLLPSLPPAPLTVFDFPQGMPGSQPPPAPLPPQSTQPGVTITPITTDPRAFTPTSLLRSPVKLGLIAFGFIAAGAITAGMLARRR
jgi:hypothetical protein